MSISKDRKVGQGICPWCGEIMDGRFDVDKDLEKYDILKEVKNLRYQAQNNRRTHFYKLAEYQEQVADWLEELVELRNNN